MTSAPTIPSSRVSISQGRTRAWFGTLNYKLDISPERLALMQHRLKKIPCQYIMGQTEMGSAGTQPHFQFFVTFVNPRTRGGVLRLFAPSKPHMEVCRGTTEDNVKYCSKTETRATGRHKFQWEVGTRPMQGNRVDLVQVMTYAIDHSLLEIWAQFPVAMVRYHRGVAEFKRSQLRAQRVKPRVKVLFGVTGSGKSHLAAMTASGSVDGNTLGTEDYFSMMMPTGGAAWFDGYHGQNHVVLEDFGIEAVDYRLFLRILDRWPIRVQVKGGSVEFAPTLIIITSNHHPRDWFPKDVIADTWEDGPLFRRIDEITHFPNRYILSNV